MALVSPDGAPERYEMLERIAVGGMAEVFRARATGAHGFEKTIAIKRILPRLVRSEEFVKRFIAEAKIAVQLTHANIVQILDFGRSGDSLFIAMEYVDGPDLARLIRAFAELGERLPIAAALHIALELCKGLDFAHRRGVIHRDISPANVLLSMAGEVKIADFGIAKAVGAGSSLTMSRRIMGKWRYMSPEQTRGERLDPRSDIFSAGVVVHELLTGLRLFGGRNIEETVASIREMEVPPPSSLRPELPPALDAVVLGALERDRERRLGAASDLVRGLTEVCFAGRLVPTALELAEAIGQAFRQLAPTDTGEEEVPAVGVDQAIAAALGGAGADPDAERVTVQLAPRRAAAPAPVADQADDEQSVEPDPAPRDLTRTTFVRGAIGADGLPEWQLPAPTPGPPRRRAGWLVAGIAGVLLVGGAITLAVSGGGGAGREARDAAPVGIPAHQPVCDAAPIAADAAPVDARTASDAAPPDASKVAAKHRVEHAVRYGTIDLYAEPWAHIYFRGRKVGTTPKRGLRLPVGHHRLELVNPVIDRKTEIEVDVPGRKPYQVAF